MGRILSLRPMRCIRKGKMLTEAVGLCYPFAGCIQGRYVTGEPQEKGDSWRIPGFLPRGIDFAKKIC